MNGLHVRGLILLAGCATEPASTVPAMPPTDLFISDYAADAIFRFDAESGALADVFAAGSEQRVDRPASVRPSPDGTQLYAAGFGRGEVVRYDRASGAMMDVFYWDTTLLEEPVELAFRGTELLVLGNDTSSAVVIDPRGIATRSFGYPLMRGAHDFVLAGDRLERMFVGTDSHPQLGHAIQVWDVERGVLLAHFGTPSELASATGLALVGATLYVADWERDQVVAFDAETGAWRGVFASELAGPISLERGPDGALYVLDRRGVHRFDPETGESLGAIVEAPELRFPRSFTFVSRG